MNEQAINDSYQLFTGAGYAGSKDDFVNLINSNENAFSDAFQLFSGAGYKGSEDGFANLMGIKGTNVEEVEYEEKKRLEDYTAEDLLNASEETFSKWLVDVAKIPGASVEEAGDVPWSNAVNVRVPGIFGGSPELDFLSIDLKPTLFGLSYDVKDNNLKKVQQLIDYSKAIKEKTWVQDFTIDLSTGETDITSGQFKWIQKTYKEAAGLDITANEGRYENQRAGYKDITYTVAKDGQELFSGSGVELVTFMSKHDISKEENAKLKSAREFRLYEYDVRQNKDLAKKIASEIKEEDILKGFQNDNLGMLISNNMDFGDDDRRSMFGRGTWKKKFNSFVKHKQSGGEEVDYRDENLMEDFKLYLDEKKKSGLMSDDYDEELYNNFVAAYEKITSSSTDNPTSIYDQQYNIYKNDKITKAGQSYFEKNVIDAGLQNLAIANSYDKDIEIKNQAEELLKTEKFLTSKIEETKEDIKRQFDEVVANAGQNGVTSIRYNDVTGLYEVDANNEEIASWYRTKLNSISRQATVMQEAYVSEIEKHNLVKASHARELQDHTVHNNFVTKNYHFGELLISDVNYSFESLRLSIPALFGHEASKNAKIEIDQNYAALNKDVGTWEEAILKR